jgi:hypothetical protein
MLKMGNEIALYNLAEDVTDKQYQDYVHKEKGPLLESMPTVTKYELVRITAASTGKIPYNYVGILHVGNLDEFYQKGTTTQKYQDFMKQLQPMLSDPNLMFGEKIY